MIQIQKFTFNPFQVNGFVCYEPGGPCLIVDPGCQGKTEEGMLEEFIGSRQLEPVAVITTHGHIDHILGVDFCKSRWKIPWHVHSGDQSLIRTATASAAIFGFELDKAPEPDHFLDGNNEFTLGSSCFSLLHVPGHSQGSVAIYYNEGKVLIAGDVLFAGSIGRTDLPGGNHAQLLSSIKNQLFVLPDDVVVWPGHGPSTTIGRERSENPYLQGVV